MSSPPEQSPFLDPDGRYCQVGQSGHIFFLGSNTGGSSVRQCSVAAGQSIAFAPGGGFCYAPDYGETEEEFRACI